MRPISPVGRVDRWAGVVFVVLVILSSATVSLPLSSDPPARISALYAQHRTVYVVAQLVGLLGVAVLLRFLVALRRFDETSSRHLTRAGVLVALAGVGTNISVLVLCFATRLSPAGVHSAAVATDVTDQVLFVAYALLMLALAASPTPRWLRVGALVTAVLCGLESLGGWVVVPWVDAAAPLAVIAVLLAVALRVVRASPAGGRRPETPTRSRRFVSQHR